MKKLSTLAVSLLVFTLIFTISTYAQGGINVPYKINTDKTYTVRDGDDLSKIGMRYGTTVQDLIRQNPSIKTTSRLRPGQTIDVSIKPTDYSKASNWVSLPNTDKNVDIFFVVPTVWFGKETITTIESGSMTEGAKMTMSTQAAAFADAGNIYAPYYRQANPEILSELSADEQIYFLGGQPATDVVAAFDYYLKNYNKDKPFILAGHSQGSSVLLFLLADYMKKHPAVQERMIAAYLIGYSVTNQYLSDNPHLKFAKGADDTGVIISYNTEMPDFKENNPVVLPGAVAINPLSWTCSEKPASAKLNLGKIKADAKIDLKRGVVTCSNVNPDDYKLPMPMFPRGTYHGGDYSFYFENLKQNALTRVAAYMKKHK